MPETRKIEHFAASSDNFPHKIGETEYEVSDEELEAELEAQAREEAFQEITTKKLVELKAKIAQLEKK